MDKAAPDQPAGPGPLIRPPPARACNPVIMIPSPSAPRLASLASYVRSLGRLLRGLKSRKCSLTCFGQRAERGPAAFSAEDDTFGNVLSQLMLLTDWTAPTDAVER